MRSLLLILFFYYLSVPVLQAQTLVENDSIAKIQYDQREDIKPLHFDEDTLEEYKQQDEFDYVEEEKAESWWTKLKRWFFNILDSIWDFLFGDIKATGFLGFLFQTIPYLIIGGIIALIIWLFIKLNPGKGLGSKNNEQEVYLSEEQEIIENKDIEALIKEAIALGNLRLAIRYYYLLILRELKNKNLINYEQEKTNEDYLKEIKENKINKPFQELTHLYDFVWYGNFTINPQQYKTAEEDFLALKKQINTRSYE